jgi:hypothetical protein
MLSIPPRRREWKSPRGSAGTDYRVPLAHGTERRRGPDLMNEPALEDRPSGEASPPFPQVRTGGVHHDYIAEVLRLTHRPRGGGPNVRNPVPYSPLGINLDAKFAGGPAFDGCDAPRRRQKAFRCSQPESATVQVRTWGATLRRSASHPVAPKNLRISAAFRPKVRRLSATGATPRFAPRRSPKHQGFCGFQAQSATGATGCEPGFSPCR